uniref:Putative secreted protein n=1 Tax=Rhipicephalus microplus TaxID=6941 RepID=A0A6G5A0Z8_RHIMP
MLPIFVVIFCLFIQSLSSRGQVLKSPVNMVAPIGRYTCYPQLIFGEKQFFPHIQDKMVTAKLRNVPKESRVVSEVRCSFFLRNS